MSEFNEHPEKSDKYNQNFSYKENKSYLKISFERIAFIFFVFFRFKIIFLSKVIVLSAKSIPERKKETKKENFRSSILYNYGNILAKSVLVINLFINSNLLINK